jgi:hypothetical protein
MLAYLCCEGDTIPKGYDQIDSRVIAYKRTE